MVSADASLVSADASVVSVNYRCIGRCIGGIGQVSVYRPMHRWYQSSIGVSADAHRCITPGVSVNIGGIGRYFGADASADYNIGRSLHHVNTPSKR